MTEAKKVPSYADRAIGAIIGSAVADAACQPVHWIYNLGKLDSLLAETPNLEFRPESANPFYIRETGHQSCYGDQAFVLLESLVEHKGLNVKDFTERTYAFFGPGTEYDTPINSPHRTKEGPRFQLPVKGPWRQGSIKEFLKNVEEGTIPTGSKVDKQMDCIAKLAPLVALYAGKAELLTKVEDAVRVTQTTEMCVALALAAARFLEYCILNGPDTDMLNDIIDEIGNPKRSNPQDMDKVITMLPGAFQAALHGVVTETEYVQAIRRTISCGGCSCSRSSFIGACLGAQVTLSGIPDSWKEKTIRYPQLLDLAEKIVKLHDDADTLE